MNSLLEIQRVSKVFGANAAVNGISFDVPGNTVSSLIGPNGAGKTTLINMISGIYEPTGGEILFNGRRITKLAPYRVAQLGISRTFQNLQICFNMTALENVMLGAHKRLDGRFLNSLLRLPGVTLGDSHCRDWARELMEFVGLGGAVRSRADSLPYGALKRLELARALVAEPKLLLLDEPAAGLNPVETEQIAELIDRLPSRGTTVLLVEHDMKLVMRVSHHIVVMNYGNFLAEGPPSEISNDPAVIEAYLGRRAA